MEKSASEPVLQQSDYHLPCHGVGDTGLKNSVPEWGFSKDDGKYSSRINMVVRQAEKVPGPGKYVAHTEWHEYPAPHNIHGGYKFEKRSRTYKPMNSTPAPHHYERKEIGSTGQSIGGSECLSKNPRVLYGKVPQGKRRSFLDQAIRHGATTPGPGHVDLKQQSCDRLDTSLKCITSWKDSQKRYGGKKPADPMMNLAPTTYKPTYAHAEEVQPCYTVPKEKGKDFLEKAIVEKWADRRGKKEIPGPGHYPVHTFDHSKVTRGTMHLQLRGLGRNPCSGYL